MLKIEILAKNQNFVQKSKVLLKNQNVWSKSKVLVRNQNLCQKYTCGKSIICGQKSNFSSQIKNFGLNIEILVKFF